MSYKKKQKTIKRQAKFSAARANRNEETASRSSDVLTGRGRKGRDVVAGRGRLPTVGKRNN